MVFVEDVRCVSTRIDVLKVFKELGSGLRFTYEVPNNGCIQFLDLSIFFGGSHVCWMYAPRSVKPIIDFRSGISKIVKNGVAMACLRASLKKSCPHRMNESFSRQIERLRQSRFPERHLAVLSERILQKMKMEARGGSQVRQKEGKPFVSIPYVHGVSHRLKKVGNRFGCSVVFSAADKLGRVCAAVGKKLLGQSKRDHGCDIKHRDKLVDCGRGVVYHIPLSCGKCYVGQTGRCVNNRLLDHKASLRGTPCSNLSLHCRECGCAPLLSEAKVLSRLKEKVAREIEEAFFINRSGEACVARPSITLHATEVDYLNACH